MTTSFHSVLNTYLLGLVSLLLAGVLALMGWGLSTIVSIGKDVSAQGANVILHTTQLVSLQADVKEVKDSQTKIQIALAAIKVPESRQ